MLWDIGRQSAAGGGVNQQLHSLGCQRWVEEGFSFGLSSAEMSQACICCVCLASTVFMRLMCLATFIERKHEYIFHHGHMNQNFFSFNVSDICILEVT